MRSLTQPCITLICYFDRPQRRRMPYSTNHFIFFRMDLYSIDMEMVQCYGSFQIMILLLVISADFRGVWLVGLLSIQL